MKEEKITLASAIKSNFKAFKICYKESPKIYISIAINEIINGITPYVAIYISAQLINQISVNRNANELLKWVMISLISALVLGVLNAISLRWRRVYYNPETQIFQEDIYRKKRIDMDFCITDSQKVRDLRSQITQDTNMGLWGLGFISLNWYPIVVKSVVSIIAGFILTINLFLSKTTQAEYLFLNNPIFIILVALLIFITLLLSSILKVKSNSYYSKELMEEIKQGNRIGSYLMDEAYNKKRGMDIRIYRQDIILTECMYNVPKTFKIGGTYDKLNKRLVGVFDGLSNAVSAFLTGIIYIYAALKAVGGAFMLGSFVQYVTASVQFVSATSKLIQMINWLKLNHKFLDTAFEYLETENVMYRGSLTTEKRSDNKYEIEFCNVSFKYPETENYVLKDVSFKFTVGEKIAVVGENGSGKTTFIKLLSKMYEPSEGKILLNGIDIKKYNYDDYIKIFSVVFQDFKLLSYTLAQNVAASTKYDEEKVIAALEKAGFSDRLKTMPNGINTYLYKDLDENGVEISGGEAQKIAIARAIYKDSAFIVLDEPTASLDPIAEAEIYEKFSEIVTDKTAIYISHRLSSCKFCDTILVFDKGSIVETGTHENLLLKQGKYKDLWQAQAQYYNEKNIS